MILSEIDLFLIQGIAESALKGEEITTWDLAKKYLKLQDNKLDNLSVLKRTEIVNGMTTSLNYRMRRMAKIGLVFINKDNCKNHYVLDSDRIRYCKHKFPSGIKQSIMALGEDSKWAAFEI